MKVSIIIPTHNRSDALTSTIERLSKQSFQDMWEVIVVNNNSTDETDSVVESWQKSFPVSLRLINEKKPGAAAARNAGARVAMGAYLIFVDNDILTEPNFLQLHLDALHQNPNSWIVGQVVNMPEQENSVFGKYRKHLFPVVPVDEKNREISGVTGQTISLPREHFIKLNGFDEDFRVASGEDNEFAMRGRKQLSITTLLVPKISVVHNDWAGWTFTDFCHRQEIYSRAEFLFWQKYGDEHPHLQLVQENLPINWRSDSPRLLVRKQIKRMLGYNASQAILLRLSKMFECSPVFRPVLWRFYKLTLAGAINRGFREGMRFDAPPMK